MNPKYQVGDRVAVVDSPYTTNAALPNGTIGTVTKVTELRGETYAVYVLPDDAACYSRRSGGSWCLYPREVKHTPLGAIVGQALRNGHTVNGFGLQQLVGRTVTGRVSLSKHPQPDNLPKPGTKENPIVAEFGRHGNHKWQTPGVYPITSYRSFRRYRAAGAAFGVVVFDTQRCLREPDPVNVSVRVARRRAQEGLALVAIVSEVQA